MEALKKYVVATARLQMSFSEFNASAGAILQLQISTVPGRLPTILDAKGNVAGEVKVLENKPVDKLLYYKPYSRLSASATMINRKTLAQPIKA